MICVGPHIVRWVAMRVKDHGNFGPSVQGIGWEREGVVRAGVVYADWNGPNVWCHIASDGSRRWMTRRYLWTIFDYPFRQLGAQRITVPVGSGNHASRRFVEHLGFMLEATLGPDSHPDGRLLVYRMYRGECRWISAATYRPLAKAA